MQHQCAAAGGCFHITRYLVVVVDKLTTMMQILAEQLGGVAACSISLLNSAVVNAVSSRRLPQHREVCMHTASAGAMITSPSQ
jgi:hypothetical protein